MKYLTIDIGGTFTKYAVMDEDLKIYEKSKVPTEKASVEAYVDMIVGLYEKYRSEVAGVAISAPGMIDSEKGFMRTGGAIYCIENLDIIKILSERIDVPVTIENDAKCAAMAEMARGSLQGCKNAAVLILGTGLGGAVFIDGKLLRGRNLLAGEFSFQVSDVTDAINPEKMTGFTVSAPALIKLAAEKTGIPAEELNGEEVFRMANEGNEAALEALRLFARRVAAQAINCQFMFDPEKIAIGGGISAQPLLFQYVKEELPKIIDIYPQKMPLPDVTVCKFFNDSNLIGALSVLLERYGQN